MSDERFRAFQDGDEGAFKEIYDTFVGLVQFVATRSGMEVGERDEVVQEAFTRLYVRRYDVHNQGALKAWLCTVVRNLAMDRLRKRRSIPFDEGVSDYAAKNACEGHLREMEVLAVREFIDQVVAASGDDTLALFYKNGMSASDIAAQKNEAVSTVTARLSRLRKKLKDQLRQHIEELRARVGP